MSEERDSKSIKPVSSVSRSAPAQTAPKTQAPQTAQKAEGAQKTEGASQPAKSEASGTGKAESASTTQKSGAAQDTTRGEASRGLRLEPDRFQKSVDLEEEETKDKAESPAKEEKEEGTALSLLRGLFGFDESEQVQKEAPAPEAGKPDAKAEARPDAGSSAPEAGKPDAGKPLSKASDLGDWKSQAGAVRWSPEGVQTSADTPWKVPVKDGLEVPGSADKASPEGPERAEAGKVPTSPAAAPASEKPVGTTSATSEQGNLMAPQQMEAASTQQLLNAVDGHQEEAVDSNRGQVGASSESPALPKAAPEKTGQTTTSLEKPAVLPDTDGKASDGAPTAKPEGLLGTLGKALGLAPQEPAASEKPVEKAPTAEKAEGLLGTLGKALGLTPQEPAASEKPVEKATTAETPAGLLGTLGKVLGLTPQESAPSGKPTDSDDSAGSLSGLLGKIAGAGARPDAASTTAVGPQSPSVGNPLLKSVLGGALSALTPLGALAPSAAGATSSTPAGTPATAGTTGTTGTTATPAPPQEPIGNLQGVSGLSGTEHQKVQDWYDGLSTEDKKWYENWVASQPPEKQEEALSYARRVQDQYVSDPQTRTQMRQEVLDEYMDQGVSKENRASMGAIVLTDENPANKRQALEDHGFTKPPADGSPAPSAEDLMCAPGAYDTRTNNVLFSTALLAQDKGTNYVTDVVGHELAHQTADSTQTGGFVASRDNQLFFALEKQRAYDTKTATPEARAQSEKDLAQLYRDSNPGSSPKEAKAWAENALSNSEEYYASVTALHRLTEGNAPMAQRVQAFDRDSHTLIHNAEAGTLPSDEQFLKSMSSKDLAARYQLDQAQLKQFDGYQEDSGRRVGLEKFLLEQVGLRLIGTNPTGTQTYGAKENASTSAVQPLSGTVSTPPATSTPTSTTPARRPARDVHVDPSTSTPATSTPSTSTPSSSTPSSSTPTSSTQSSSTQSSSSRSYQSQSYQSQSWNDLSSTGFSSLGNASLSLAEIQQMLPEGIDLTGLDIKTLDLNQDGRVTKADLSQLSQMAKAGNVAPDGDNWTPLSRLLVQLGGQSVQPGSLASVFSGSAVRRLAERTGDQATPGTGAPSTEAGNRQAAQPASVAPVTGAPTASAGGSPPGATRDPGMTALRVGIFREATTSLESLAAGTPQNQGLWVLDSLGREADGRLGVTDALETLVTGHKGPEKMIGVFNHAASSPDQALAMSSVLKNMSQAAPDRAVGILLLTMDAPGGTESVSKMFSAMSQEPGGAINLAQFLQAGATNPASSHGLWEMMDTLTTPTLEDTNGGRRLAGALGRSSEWVQGSQALTRTFSALLDTEGGGTRFANLVHRMSDSHQGAADTARMLQNMAFDKEGGREVGKLMAQGTQSRSGARALVDSLNRMAATKEGGVSVGRLFMGLSGSRDGARVLANLARDSSSAAPLLSLMNRLEANPPAAARFSRALDQMAADPKLRTEMAIFRGRAAANPELEAALQRVWRPQQAGVAREAAPMPLSWGGALAMEQAGLAPRQATLPGAGQPAATVAVPVAGHGAPVAASAQGAGAGQREGRGDTGQESRRPFAATQAAPPEVAGSPSLPSARPGLPARIAWPALGEAGLPPATFDTAALTTGRAAETTGPVVRASLLPPAPETASQPAQVTPEVAGEARLAPTAAARGAQPAGPSAEIPLQVSAGETATATASQAATVSSEAHAEVSLGDKAGQSTAPGGVVAGRPAGPGSFPVGPGVFANDLETAAGLASARPEEAEPLREAGRAAGIRPGQGAVEGTIAAQGARASVEVSQSARTSGETAEPQKAPTTPFRPGDYYSEETLRSLRLCPECGFRTSAGGVCARCVSNAFREGRTLRAVVGIQS